jgi:hypothetical protein
MVEMVGAEVGGVEEGTVRQILGRYGSMVVW